MALPDDASIRFDILEEIGQGTYGLVHRYSSSLRNLMLMLKTVRCGKNSVPLKSR